MTSNSDAQNEQSTLSGEVTSVAGRTGDVVLTRNDVGLGNVDNTADADKPVSSSQAAAIAAASSDCVQRIAWDPAKVVSGACLRIKPGTYSVTAPITFSNVKDCVIEWEPGAILQDGGRLVTGVNGVNGRLPYGVRFDNTCSGIRWVGEGLVRTAGGSLGGQSTGFFDATNYTERRPVIWFDGCRDVTFQSKLDGDSGRSYDAAAYTSIYALTPSMTLDEKAAVYGRTFMVSFTNCVTVHCDITSYGEASKREQVFIGAGTKFFSFTANDYSSQNAETWASMAKFIGVQYGTIGPITGLTASNKSLLDLIGSDVLVRDIHLDFPGKIVDISHEHGPRNQPMRNITVQNCVNNNRDGGLVVINAGTAGAEDVIRSPIRDVRIVNCSGALRLGNMSQTTVVNHLFYDAPVNTTSFTGGDTDYVNCIIHYSGASGVSRSMTLRAGTYRFLGCRWYIESGSTTAVSFGRGSDVELADVKLEFRDCLMSASVDLALGVNTSFFDTDLTGITVTKSGTPTVLSYTPTPTVV